MADPAPEPEPELGEPGDEMEALQLAWANVSRNAQMPDSFKGYLEQVSALISHPVLQSQARYEEEDVRRDKTRLVRYDHVCEALWTMTRNIAENETKGVAEIIEQRVFDLVEGLVNQTLAAFAIFGGWRSFARQMAKAWRIADWITPVLRCDRELERRVKWLRKKALKQSPNRRTYRNILVRY